jgi:hypothetical protein
VRPESIRRECEQLELRVRARSDRLDAVFGFRNRPAGRRLLVVSPQSVTFELADGTTVIVERNDLRGVYEALWDLSRVPGAISTAALLLDEAGRPRNSRPPVNLNQSQSDVLRRALDDFAD